MRPALLLSLLLIALLAGCASPDAASTGEDDIGYVPAKDPAPRKGVVFFEADYSVMPEDVAVLDVDMPEGAQNVRVEVAVRPTNTPQDEADVSLSGCGSGHVSWNPGPNISISVSVLGSWRKADLCGLATGGAQTLTIDGGVTPMVGRVLLRADLPAN